MRDIHLSRTVSGAIVNSSMAGVFTRITTRRVVHAGILLAILTALITAIPVNAQSGVIVLDGQFDDWLGLPSIPDVQGDAQNNHSDLASFYFTSYPDLDYLYFMAERWEPGSEGLELRLYIDANNNGDYSETADRIISVSYNPNFGGRTTVDLYDGRWGFLSHIASNANWGEPGKGTRVEWGLTFTDLRIAPFQTINMQLVSNNGNNVSDGVAEVQWSPANALGWYLLALLTLGGVGWLYFRRRVIS
jgi:hypothetical protein